MLKLTKVVPARRKTVELRWCKQEFMRMTPRYREIRKNLKSPMDACWWCSHQFIDGEMMALAAPKKGTNKLLCQSCASSMLQEQGE